MLTLNIEFDKPFSSKRLEIVDEFRRQIVPIGEAIGEEDVFNWKNKTSPAIIYSRPSRNKLKLIGVSGQGADALEKAKSAIADMGEFIFENGRYKVLSIKDSLSTYLPRSAQKEVFYHTASPLLLFTNYGFAVYEGIEKTAGKDRGKMLEIIKRDSIQMIKNDIKHKLCDYIGTREYAFVDNIKMEWTDIRMTFVPYHKDERLTPALLGTLKTNFYLPPFIGTKTGKGFGELIEVNEIKGGKQ